MILQEEVKMCCQRKAPLLLHNDKAGYHNSYSIMEASGTTSSLHPELLAWKAPVARRRIQVRWDDLRSAAELTLFLVSEGPRTDERTAGQEGNREEFEAPLP